MVVQRKDSGEVDTYVNEQEVDVEEGGATLEDERGRRVGDNMKEVGRYNDEDDDSGVEENNDDEDEDVENNDVENVDVDAEG